MRKLLITAVALLVCGTSLAEVWEARYATAETFDFKLYNADGTLDVDEADGGSEVSVSCNEGAETTATNDFVDEGNFYSIALTSGEMTCERIAVVIAATTTEVFFIQTIGHASAMTPDFVQTGDSFARLGAPAGASVSADIAAAKVDTAAILDDTGTTGVLVSSSSTNCRAPLGCSATGTLSGTHSATTADLGGSAPGATSDLVGKTLVIPAKFFSRSITAYDTGTGVATFDSTSLTLANADVWYLWETAPGGGDVNVTTIEGSDATTVLGTAQTGDAYARLGAPAGASIAADILVLDNFLDTEIAAILADTNELQVDWVNGGRLDLLLDLTLADTNELQVDWVNGGRLDLLIDSIKAKTDPMTYTSTNFLQVDVQKMNTVDVLGVGTAADPWNGE